MEIFLIEYRAHTAGHYSKEIQDFANSISENVQSVNIFTPFGFRENFLLNKNVFIHSLLKKYYKNEYLQQILFYLKTFLQIKKNVSIVHIWGFRSVFPLFISYKFLRRHFILIITLKAVKKQRIGIFKDNMLGVIQENLSIWCLRKLAVKYIVHNKYIYNEAIELGIPSHKLMIIPTGISEYKLNLSKYEARKYLGIEEEMIILLFFGVIREEKGIYEILNITKNFDDKMKLLIAGENWLDKNIQTLIDEYNIREKVIIVDSYIPEKDVKYYFMASDVNLIFHKPFFKGESGVLLKSIEYEIPILTHVRNSAANIIEINKLGKICKYQDSFDLIKAANDILNEEKFFILNIQKYKEKNSLKKEAIRYFELYSSVANN